MPTYKILAANERTGKRCTLLRTAANREEAVRFAAQELWPKYHHALEVAEHRPRNWLWGFALAMALAFFVGFGLIPALETLARILARHA